ncbi:Two component sensor histidine kinase [Geobacillus proteiniphilus]|uniref:Two component sensor histidine kinase n=1 Tax=Geobacillus proteiniphilus TaxID=860353 RepID=A0A1Q5T7W3_9BACL|nr:PAS domain S-box protein [Geobacillus proteiniphilus]OKO96321.1 Two component sensor histidine kinase [Geobacillus proteiniphilus]
MADEEEFVKLLLTGQPEPPKYFAMMKKVNKIGPAYVNEEEVPALSTRDHFAYIQDGIIVMDHERTIVEMNPAAKRLTGWQLGEKVPYCSFCQQRKVKEGEERCYLIATEEVPYFVSEMPTDHGQWIDVEMSTELILEQDKAKYYLLVLRDQTAKKKEEEARRSKWMVKKLTEAKEQEHKRLAQELHDGVGQSLYSISIALDNIIQRVQDEKLHIYVKEVREELGRVMEDVKL